MEGPNRGKENARTLFPKALEWKECLNHQLFPSPALVCQQHSLVQDICFNQVAITVYSIFTFVGLFTTAKGFWEADAKTGMKDSSPAQCFKRSSQNSSKNNSLCEQLGLAMNENQRGRLRKSHVFQLHTQKCVSRHLVSYQFFGCF